MNAITRVQPDGQVVVPSDAIEAAHLAPGPEIEVEVRPDGVMLRRRTKNPFRRTTLAELRAFKPYDGPPKSVEEISSVPESALRDHYRREFPGR